MKKLIVDRYEGTYTICEDKDQKYFAIDTSEMPENAKPGTVIIISDEGTILIDEAETQRRRERILAKQNKLMSKE